MSSINKQQAQQLIKETFETRFDKGRFSGFVRNLLNHIEDAPFTYQGKYIPEKFRQYIKSLERIGKYNDGEHTLDILVITLQKETSLERARTMQRNFIAWYLNGSRGGEMKDAALVAFVAPGEADWRFSLVKMDYKFEKTKTGKMKVKEEFTPARRWSFLVGINEKSHTAQSRLVKILADDEHDHTLAELEEAFNIETVTKEFFLKYRELFLLTKKALDRVVENNPKVKADFDVKGVDTVNFAKKLLGQIVFLYFLQKKGWFGVSRDDDWGTGSKQFLRELFEGKHGSYNNFFNDILEPLFYEALRIDRSHDDDYYSRFNCKIPFLNGGLFDPIGNYDWVHTDINLPNDLFSSIRKTKEGDTGNGILDVFDRYNFTVREDEPLEKEVAIDPELLGKAYEKFNAIRPDNFEEFTKALKSGRKGEENKFNKKFGVYYTPREIVHYMCQQSLINYLYTRADAADLSSAMKKQDIEDLIEVGEMITEHEATALVKEQHIKNGIQKSTEYTALLADSIRENAESIDKWLEEITVCDPAVGSGAFPLGMMNEIVRARNVLSVFLNNQERSDFEFKRRCIEHSLYGVDIDPGAVEIAKLRLWLSLVVDEEDINNIKPLPNLDYKVVCGNSLLGVEKDLFNHQLFNDLEELKPLYFNETNPTKKQEYKKQIDDLISKITNGHKDFDFKVYFSEVFHNKGGFDVVIANPPYVRKENLDTETIKELEQHFKEEVKGKLKKWSDDLYVHFIFQGIKIACNKGIVSYITNDSFIGLSSKLRVRRLLLQYNLHKLIRCPVETFEATIYTAVFLLQKSEACDGKYETGYFSYPDFVYHVLGYVPYEVVFTLPKERLIFAGPILKLYEKLLDLPKVKEFLRILDTGIHSGNVREKIFFGKKTKENLQRLLQGKQIERWGIFWDRQEARYKYCDIEYEPKPQKGIGRKGQLSKLNEYWHFCGDIENHQQPERLLMRQSDDDLVVAYQNEKEMGRFYTDNTLFTIMPKRADVSLKYAMALLNSKLLNTLYQFLSQEEGKTLAQVKTGLVGELPFVLGDQAPLIDIVDKILAVTKDDDYLENTAKQAKVREYEKQIDQLVYELYGLTAEEIKIVENDQL